MVEMRCGWNDGMENTRGITFQANALFYAALYRVLHIYWAGVNDSPFLSQLTQEIVMHFFRKP